MRRYRHLNIRGTLIVEGIGSGKSVPLADPGSPGKPLLFPMRIGMQDPVVVSSVSPAQVEISAFSIPKARRLQIIAHPGR